MNERIWELWHQATLDPANEDSPDLVEKFAELIVRECENIIEFQDVDPAFKNRMAHVIKKHFGVEE